MQRAIEALEERFDVLVLGGGIHGACLARTLARSGIRVALVEKDDFGGATSHNSLKIVHGGLRYIQHLDVGRIRESVAAQHAWLSAAPQLVRPLRFTMPTRGHGARSPLALALGAMVYQMLGGRSRRRSTPRADMPNARLQGATTFRQHFPEAVAPGLNGALSWFDAQILDPGRLITECLVDTCRAGATVINHAEAVNLLREGKRVSGAVVRDRMSGREHEVRARITVATLGPWGAGLAATAGLPRNPGKTFAWTRNLNVVLRRPVVAAHEAVGLTGRERTDSLIGSAGRLYFITPWRGRSIVGTSHQVHDGDPETMTPAKHQASALLEGVRSTLRDADLGLDDVAYLHLGLTPAEDAGRSRARRTAIVDFARDHGIEGYLQVTANKYTTAPTASHRLAGLILRRLGVAGRTPASFAEPLPGAAGWPPDDSVADTPLRHGDSDEHSWVRGIYGPAAEDILGTAAADPHPEPRIRLFHARVIYGVRNEMAVRLGDVIFRCTDLAEQGELRDEHLEWCADRMADLLNWTTERRRDEMISVRRRLQQHMSGGPDRNWSSQTTTHPQADKEWQA